MEELRKDQAPGQNKTHKLGKNKERPSGKRMEEDDQTRSYNPQPRPPSIRLRIQFQTDSRDQTYM